MANSDFEDAQDEAADAREAEAIAAGVVRDVYPPFGAVDVADDANDDRVMFDDEHEPDGFAAAERRDMDELAGGPFERAQLDAADTKGTGLPTAARAEQLNAFGPEPGAAHVGPVARKTDPPTSKRAAVRASKGLSGKQLAVLDTFQRASHPMTHEQLIERFRARLARISAARWYPVLGESSIRTRCKELVTLGYVRHVDDAGFTASGGRSARWAITPSGGALDVDAERARRCKS